MNTQEITTGKTSIKNYTTSEKLWKGETKVSRFSKHHIGDGVYEITALCAHPEGGRCYRSFGLFDGLDEIPQCYWNGN